MYFISFKYYTHLLTLDWNIRGLNPCGSEILSIPVHPVSCKKNTRFSVGQNGRSFVLNNRLF